jgi:hypothetical protein
MTIRTLHFRSSLITLLIEIRYTLSRLSADPLGEPHAPVFEALRDEWAKVQTIELACQEAISDAQAKVDAADDGLDDFANRLSKTVLTITADDRTHPLYLHFFGDKPLAQFIRPALGAQFKAMQDWPQSLTDSEHGALKAMAPELAVRLAAADAAVKAKASARQQNKQFRDVGERKQFADKLNGARKERYGALAKLPHIESGLPADFADQFFRRSRAAEDVEQEGAEETVASVTKQVSLLEEELAARKERLEELKTEEAEAAKGAAALSADKAALAALEKEIAEAEQKAAALKAKIGDR